MNTNHFPRINLSCQKFIKSKMQSDRTYIINCITCVHKRPRGCDWMAMPLQSCNKPRLQKKSKQPSCQRKSEKFSFIHSIVFLFSSPFQNISGVLSSFYKLFMVTGRIFFSASPKCFKQSSPMPQCHLPLSILTIKFACKICGRFFCFYY